MAAGRSEVDLGPFTSSLAARWVAELPDRTHRQIEGSLVSADLSGFTALSERLAERGKRGAEDLTAMVNACFTALIRAAAADGGDVLKFGGDALLVWFEGDDHAVRAARAATRMQRAIGGARFRRAGLSMSVGAHTDTFDHFLVGQPEWRELVVVGRPVSTTVELEAAATAGEVLISPELAAAVPDEWLGERRADGVLVAVDDVAGVGARLRPRVRESIDGAAAARLVAPSLQSHVAALAGTSGEHRLATVVFAELEGTDASVAGGAEVFARSVDDLVRSVEGLADRYGLLFLYTDVIADGIKFIVVAGAPTSTGEDEEAGLRFATDLVAGDPKHKLRVGVNRGRVFAGFLGSEDRRTYTVMGDPVNLSARLMAKAEPGQVLGSDDVVRASRAEFQTTPVAPFLVKGKAKPVSAHVVGAGTGGRRSHVVAALPLVGRAAEVAVLRDAVRRASGGSGQVVELVGDAGIGKTRLIQAVSDDPAVLVRVTTECQPYDVLSPFAAIRPLLRRALGVAEAALPVDAGHQLATIVQRLAPELVPLLPLLAPVIGADVPATPESDAVAEEFRSARMHRCVLDLLAVALPTSTLLVVEDIYYVDDASLQLLRAVAEEVPRRPWAMFITRRPEGPGLVVGEVDGTLLKLAPLESDEVGRLAEMAVGDPSVGAADLAVLADRSGGNPLFILELVEAARSGVAEDDLPESIERLVAARVDRLAPDDRALLRQAAVVGRVFHTGLVNALFAVEGRSTVQSEQWERLGEFVEPDGVRRWRFRHALFRDVAYEGLPFARRKRMHGSVGELLEAGVAGEPDVALLSFHFWMSGDALRTWQYSVQAGDLAWGSYAVNEATAAYRRALTATRRLRSIPEPGLARIAGVLGDVLERSARYDEALAAYRSARRRSQAGGLVDQARLLRKIAVVHARQGDYARAERALRRCLRMLGDTTGEVAERGNVELELAAIAYRRGRHGDTAGWAREAQVSGTAAGDQRIVAYASNLLQVAATHSGSAGGIEHGERALALFRELGDVHNEGKALNNLGIHAYFRGDWKAAQGRYTEARSAFERSGDVAEAAIAANNLGEILSDQGHLIAAIDAFTSAHRTWTASGYRLGMSLADANLGRALVRNGDLEKGIVTLRRAIDGFKAMGSSSFVCEVQVRLAEAALFAGDPVSALQSIGLVLDRSPETQAYPSTIMGAYRLRAMAALQGNEVDAAAADLVEAERLAEAEDARFELALVWWAMDLVDRRRGTRSGIHRSRSQELLDELAVVSVPDLPMP